MAVDAIMHLDQEIALDLNMVGIKRVPGGSTTVLKISLTSTNIISSFVIQDSFLVHGVAFKKTFSYAGFEQAPKYFKDPKICLLNVELELKSESSNAEIRIKDPKQYQSIVDAEW